MSDSRRDQDTEAVIETSEWRWVYIASALLLILISLPFMIAYAAGGPDHQFMGVLVNPIDGLSYQAKMYQGFMGSWLFHLPYTPEPHRGVVLLTFYLMLGQIARILNLPIILVFHAARLIGALLMFVTLYAFIADWTGDVTQRRVTWGLAVVAGGFGWLALLFGQITPDLLLLPEAFPLQAAYANAHFPWAIAAAVWIAHALVSAAVGPSGRWPALDTHTLALVAATVLVVSISPFIMIPLAAGYAALCGLLWARRRAYPAREVTWGVIVVIFGLPIIAYGLWAVSGANPVFQAWMSQNQTPSPPVWEYLVAFGPLLILTGIGLWGARRYLRVEHGLLIGWILATAVMLYAPFGLQRRFATGITIPLAIFAGIGLWRVIFPLIAERWHTTLLIVILSLAAPTTVMALSIPLVGIRNPTESYSYYLSRSEAEAFTWLQNNASPRNALVLASPQTGLILPTRGLRVVYGHPFETLHAAERLREVTAFYQGTDCSVVEREQVRYIFVGPWERKLASDKQMCPLPEPSVYTTPDGDVAIYAIAGQ